MYIPLNEPQSYHYDFLFQASQEIKERQSTKKSRASQHVFPSIVRLDLSQARKLLQWAKDVEKFHHVSISPRRREEPKEKNWVITRGLVDGLKGL